MKIKKILPIGICSLMVVSWSEIQGMDDPNDGKIDNELYRRAKQYELAGDHNHAAECYHDALKKCKKNKGSSILQQDKKVGFNSRTRNNVVDDFFTSSAQENFSQRDPLEIIVNYLDEYDRILNLRSNMPFDQFDKMRENALNSIYTFYLFNSDHPLSTITNFKPISENFVEFLKIELGNKCYEIYIYNEQKFNNPIVKKDKMEVKKHKVMSKLNLGLGIKFEHDITCAYTGLLYIASNDKDTFYLGQSLINIAVNSQNTTDVHINNARAYRKEFPNPGFMSENMKWLEQNLSNFQYYIMKLNQARPLIHFVLQKFAPGTDVIFDKFSDSIPLISSANSIALTATSWHKTGKDEVLLDALIPAANLAVTALPHCTQYFYKRESDRLHKIENDCVIKDAELDHQLDHHLNSQKLLLEQKKDIESDLKANHEIIKSCEKFKSDYDNKYIFIKWFQGEKPLKDNQTKKENSEHQISSLSIQKANNATELKDINQKITDVNALRDKIEATRSQSMVAHEVLDNNFLQTSHKIVIIKSSVSAAGVLKDGKQDNNFNEGMIATGGAIGNGILEFERNKNVAQEVVKKNWDYQFSRAFDITANSPYFTIYKE